MSNECIALKRNGEPCKYPYTTGTDGLLCGVHLNCHLSDRLRVQPEHDNQGIRARLSVLAEATQREEADAQRKDVEQIEPDDTGGQPWITALLNDSRSLGFILFAITVYLTELLEMKILQIPKNVALSTFDVVALSFGNIVPVMLLIVLAGLVLVLVFWFAAVCATAALVVAVAAYRILISGVFVLITFSARVVLAVVRVSITPFVVWFRLFWLMEPLPERRLFFGWNAWLVQRTAQMLARLRSGPARTVANVRTGLTHISGAITAIRERLFTSRINVFQTATIICLCGIVIFFSTRLTRDYAQRIDHCARDVQICLARTNNGRGSAPFADLQRVGLDTTSIQNYVLSFIQPVNAGFLGFDSNFTGDIRKLHDRKSVNDAPYPDYRDERPVIYVGDYGDWAVVVPTDDGLWPVNIPAPEDARRIRVLVRRKSITDFTPTARIGGHAPWQIRLPATLRSGDAPRPKPRRRLHAVRLPDDAAGAGISRDALTADAMIVSQPAPANRWRPDPFRLENAPIRLPVHDWRPVAEMAGRLQLYDALDRHGRDAVIVPPGSPQARFRRPGRSPSELRNSWTVFRSDCDVHYAQLAFDRTRDERCRQPQTSVRNDQSAFSRAFLEIIRGHRHAAELRNCLLTTARALGVFEFSEGRVRPRRSSLRARTSALGETITSRASLPEAAEPEHTLYVLIRAGASNTGPIAANLALSEARAETVQRLLIRHLRTRISRADPKWRRIEFVAFGTGERISPVSGQRTVSARAAQVYICSVPEFPLGARVAGQALSTARDPS